MHKGMVLRSADFVQTRSKSSTHPEVDDGFLLSGYLAVFDQDTEIRSPGEGWFTERVSRGAFLESLKRRTPVVQYDHGRDSRVGSVPIAEILELREDSNGLFLEAKMFDNPTVEPVRQAIAAQSISGGSFKFRVTRDEWRDSKGKRLSPAEAERLLAEGRAPLKRNIKQVELAELGPVVFPAYAGTSVGVRTRDNAYPPELLKMRLSKLNWT